MIELPEFSDDLHGMWVELMLMNDASPAPWVLIGAHMVALHGWAKGKEQIRQSRDADVLVNVRAVTDGTARVSQVLIDRDFAFDGASPEGVGHRFVRGGISIDVLGPDGLGERADLRTAQGAHTL